MTNPASHPTPAAPSVRREGDTMSNDTQPRPAPQPPKVSTCPHCRGDLSVTQRGKHCAPLSDRKPHPTCTWLKCACDAVVDLNTKNHTHATHKGPPSEWNCRRGYDA